MRHPWLTRGHILGILAFRYGLLSPLDWGADCEDHLHLMTDLWNAFVRVERQYREELFQTVDGAPQVAQKKARLEELRTARDGLARRSRAERVRVQTYDADREIAEQLEAAERDYESIRSQRVSEVRDLLETFDEKRKERIKEARQRSGLWWGNYTAVWHKYTLSRLKVLRRGQQLRERPFTGEGRFTIQIRNGVEVSEFLTRRMDGRRPLALNLEGRPVADRKGLLVPQLTFTIYTTPHPSGKGRLGRTVTWPIVYDRPLPVGSRIKQVYLTRRRVGTHWHYSVSFLCQSPDQVVEPTAPVSTVCGIDLGFRRVVGGLRVATVSNGTDEEFHIIPDQWLSAFDTLSDLQGRRARALRTMHDVIKAARGQVPADGPYDLLEHLRSIAESDLITAESMRSLVRKWAQHASWWPEMLARLEGWRRRDTRRLNELAYKRANLLLARREGYRLLARKLVMNYRVMCISFLPLDAIKRRKRWNGGNSWLSDVVRRNRVRAALSSLRLELERQAEKHGTVIEYATKPLTRMCHRCGFLCVLEHSAEAHTCEHCNSTWDPDVNSARNLVQLGQSVSVRSSRK